MPAQPSGKTKRLAEVADAGPPARSALWQALHGPSLERHQSATLPVAEAAFAAHLQTVVEPSTEPFTLVSKLSGGGIVVRALRTPDTPRPFFGRVHGRRFTIAPTRKTGNVTPFQPLIRGTWAAVEGGTRVELNLAPHPNAQNWDILFTIAGLGLLPGAAIQALSNVPLAAALAAFGLAALGFPRLRARASFGAEVDIALQSLAQALEAPALSAEAE